MPRIYILPLDSVGTYILDRIAKGVESCFHLSPAILPAITVPPDALDASRRQYHSTVILRRLAAHLPPDGLRILGITNVDLYVPRLRFVFGEAVIHGKVAVVSIHRLRPEFYGQASDNELLAERTIKEVIHELGHTFGLQHCLNPQCVMFFSNTVQDTDRKLSQFCESCRVQIEDKVTTAS